MLCAFISQRQKARYVLIMWNAFLAPPLLEQPRIVRNAKNEVHIDVESEGATFYYTTDGTEPTAQSAKYEVPFYIWTRKEPSKRLLMMRSPANPVL